MARFAQYWSKIVLKIWLTAKKSRLLFQLSGCETAGKDWRPSAFARKGGK
jgi:hypothetical protein